MFIIPKTKNYTIEYYITLKGSIIVEAHDLTEAKNAVCNWINDEMPNLEKINAWINEINCDGWEHNDEVV